MVRLVRSGDGPIFQSTAPEWLQELLLRGPCRALKLGPEDRQCIAFGDRLREAALLGKLHCTFTHIPHEVGGGTKNAGLRYALAAALGLVAGSGDYAFIWKGGGMWVEFKRAAEPANEARKRKSGGSLSAKQRKFRDWCELVGAEYHVVRTASEGLMLLRDKGQLDAV